MYKSYSDSYLMTKSKKTLIEYLRVAEHNHRVCEETIDQQAKNCMELLKKERVDTIDEIIKTIDEQNYCMQEECPFNACRFEGCPINRNAEVIFQTWLKKLKEQK